MHIGIEIEIEDISTRLVFRTNKALYPITQMIDWLLFDLPPLAHQKLGALIINKPILLAIFHTIVEELMGTIWRIE